MKRRAPAIRSHGPGKAADGKPKYDLNTFNLTWADEGRKDTDHDGMEDGREVRTYGRTETQDHKTFDPKYEGGKCTCLERFLHYKAGDTPTDNGETNKQ